jgi:esterase/lipase
MRKKDYSRALIFGLSMSGVLAAMAALTVRLLMMGLGLDLFLRILGP